MTRFAEFCVSLSHAAVRDLAWVIASAPIFQTTDPQVSCPDNAACLQELENFTSELRQLDQDPSLLMSHLENNQDRRLGAYFESLMAFWFLRSEKYQLLHHRLPLRADNQTLGELDFVIQNLEMNRVEHWEVAVKFYLGVPSEDFWLKEGFWVGPGLKDHLHLKRSHLLTRQITRGDQPPIPAILERLGVHIDHRIVWVKGRLFYPRWCLLDAMEGIAKEHQKGWWRCPEKFLQQGMEKRWRILQKTAWFAAVQGTRDPCFSGPEIVDLANRARRPICVAEMSESQEQSRGFVVPEGWVARAATAIARN